MAWGQLLQLVLLQINLFKLQMLVIVLVLVLEIMNIEKITKDHSLVQELLDLGTISEEEAVNIQKKM